jgi:ComF family protein
VQLRQPYAGGGRFVFSSSADPTRVTGAKVVAKESFLVSRVSSAAESLFATLFPADCQVCGAALITISRLPVCKECLSEMRPISGGVCVICGQRLLSPSFSSGSGEPCCRICRRLEPEFVRAIAYGSYDGGLRELIHLLKYEQVRPAASVLGRMLAEAIAGLEPSFGDEPVLVLPVALHPEKLRQRGFNQSELIARAALKLRSDQHRLILDSAVLARRRATQSQTGLTRHQRRENLRGAFAVVQPEAVAGREILLVDDVFTTGTTVSECARILRRGGASKVWVATVARTLKANANHADLEPGIENRMAVAAHG